MRQGAAQAERRTAADEQADTHPDGSAAAGNQAFGRALSRATAPDRERGDAHADAGPEPDALGSALARVVAERNGTAGQPGAAAPSGTVARLKQGTEVQGRDMGTGISDSDKAEKFKEADGDKLVEAVRSAAGAWSSYRKKPSSGKWSANPAMTGVKSALGNGPDAWPEGWMKDFASKKVGSENLTYLSEMASVSTVFPKAKALSLFNIEVREVKNEYELTLNAAGSGPIDQALALVTKGFTVTCSNNLGWGWTQDFNMTGVSISAELSIGAGVEVGSDEEAANQETVDKIVPEHKRADKSDPLPDPVAPGSGFNPSLTDRYKPRVKKVEPKLEGGTKVGKFDVGLDANTKANSDRFWGPDDFSGAAGSIDFPSAKFAGPLGGVEGKTGAGLIFTEGEIGTIDFTTFTANASGTVDAVDPAFVSKVELSITLAKVGAAVVTQSGTGRFGAPVVATAPVVDDSRSWRRELGPFKTSSADIEEVRGQLIDMATLVWAELDPVSQTEGLREAGIDPETNFTLDVTCIGLTSRAWKGAGSEDDERLQKNEELAVQRASAAGTFLQNWFQVPVNVTATGGGLAEGAEKAAGWDAQGGGAGATWTEAEYIRVECSVEDNPAGWWPHATGRTITYRLNDAEAEQKFKELRDADHAEMMAQRITPEVYFERLKALENNLGRQGDDASARGVRVIVSWKGKRVADDRGVLPTAVGAP